MGSYQELIKGIEEKIDSYYNKAETLFDAGDTADGHYCNGYGDALDWVLGRLKQLETSSDQ